MTDEPSDLSGGVLRPRGTRGEASTHDTGTSEGQDQLALRLSEVSRSLAGFDSPATTLEGIVGAAIELIPGVDEGSISLVLGRRRVFSEAPSGKLPRTVDALQEETGQGPCLDAAYQHETVRVPDMSREQRWPLFAARAAGAGAGGMLSFQLFVSGEDLGALNLYSHRAGAFTDASEHVGLMFVSHAAVAYASIRRQTELVEAVASRLVIGQAQGMLMERYQLDPAQAFAVLVRASQSSKRQAPLDRRAARRDGGTPGHGQTTTAGTGQAGRQASRDLTAREGGADVMLVSIAPRWPTGLATARQGCLDELQRRHLHEFTGWLHAGARAARRPRPVRQQQHEQRWQHPRSHQRRYHGRRCRQRRCRQRRYRRRRYRRRRDSSPARPPTRTRPWATIPNGRQVRQVRQVRLTVPHSFSQGLPRCIQGK